MTPKKITENPKTEPGPNFPLDLIPTHYKNIDTELSLGNGFICFCCVHQWQQGEGIFMCHQSFVPDEYTRHRTFSRNGIFHVPNGDFDSTYFDDYMENCNHYKYDPFFYLRPVF